MAGWWRDLFGGGTPRWDGRSGRPRSSNGASSFHLSWVLPDGGDVVEVRATLRIDAVPSTPTLCFWALQAGFDDRGRSCGAGHLGLQWHPGHPGGTAVNWGGYDDRGGELRGSASPLPSATGNVNTRDFAWSVGRPYRLRISCDAEESAGAGLRAWRGEVLDVATGGTTVVRDLYSAGDRLTSAVVWTENFGPCDAPTFEARWSDLEAVAADGSVHGIEGVRVNYQSVADGGCVDTDSSVEPLGTGSIVQRTSTARLTSQGSVLRIG